MSSADSRTRQPTDVAGVYRRGDRFEVRYRDGGQVRSRSFRTKSEAKRFKSQLGAGVKPGSRQPFRDHARSWATTYSGRTARGVADQTRASYRDSLEQYAIPFFRSTKLDDVDAPQLKRYVAHLAKAGLKPASVRRHFAVVRALFADAVSDGLIATNPAREVRVIVPDSRPAIDRRLTSEQTKALLAEIPAEHADLVYLLASAGLRISEALNVVWSDLGSDGGPTLTVRKSKTAAGRRTIALTPDAARRLMRRRGDAAEGDPIFPSAAGTPMDARGWRRRVFRPAAARAGVPNATPHWLRHGVASLMAENGYGPADIAAHLGHADGGQLALRTYVHPTVQRVDFLDAELGGVTS